MNYQKLLPALFLLLGVSSLHAQISFSNKTNLLDPSNHNSGVTMAVIDMNGDGLDDIVRLNQGIHLNIQYQTAPNEAFTSIQAGQLPGTNQSQWGMCTADIDNNGYADVLAGGRYDGIKIARANADGSAFNFMTFSNPATFVQGVNFADINNDGWLDAFVCHDDGTSRIFGNNGDGTFTYRPTWITLATVPSSDNSGNYGSVWSDVDNDGDTDLYIAHCRQGVNDPADPRRINQLFLNNGNGTYTQDITNTSGLRIGAQSWTADFGDIDNDGDFDCFITNHDFSSQLLLNDGAGHFTDISANSGIFNAVTGTPIQGVFRDFDNDGYIDIAVAGSKHFIFRNNHNKTFSKLTNAFSSLQMESFAIGDLNSDGFQDVYAGYGGIYTNPSTIPDALWMNNGNSNHFFGLLLRGMQSNKSGIGAKVHLYSALGIQTREARSGESYGISNSPLIHFGMAQVEYIDSVVVKWPSGLRQVIYNPVRDQYATLIEGGCLIPSIRAKALGTTILCPGQTVDIQAPAGYQYAWNTGDTSQTINVAVAGEYRVTVSSDNSCSAVSNSIIVTEDPALPPQITVAGDTIICAGSTLTLSAPAAVSYLWSNGATTQSINIGQSGDYIVTTQGLCALLSSPPVNITALTSALPGGLDIGLPYDSTSLLNPIQVQEFWYDAANSTTPLPNGNPFVSPPPVHSPVYWVSNTTTYDQPNQFVGMKDHQGSLQSDNTYNGGLKFDCYAACRLAQTKVYATVAGERKIDLFDSDNQLLQSKTVFIPAGTSVIDLGFDLPVASDLLLTTDPTVNMDNLGTESPQLRRSTQGCSYPYVIPKYISIKNSSIDATRYFYFYDWEIDFHAYACESARLEVSSEVQPSTPVASPEWASRINVFPNPTSEELNISVSGNYTGQLTLSLKNAQGITLMSKTALEGASGNWFQLSTGHLPKGVYWVELSGEPGVVRKTVLLQ